MKQQNNQNNFQDSALSQNKFSFIFLGQSVLAYRVPLDVFGTINEIYEERINELYPANKSFRKKHARIAPTESNNNGSNI